MLLLIVLGLWIGWVFGTHPGPLALIPTTVGVVLFAQIWIELKTLSPVPERGGLLGMILRPKWFDGREFRMGIIRFGPLSLVEALGFGQEARIWMFRRRKEGKYYYQPIFHNARLVWDKDVWSSLRVVKSEFPEVGCAISCLVHQHIRKGANAGVFEEIEQHFLKMRDIAVEHGMQLNGLRIGPSLKLSGDPAQWSVAESGELEFVNFRYHPALIDPKTSLTLVFDHTEISLYDPAVDTTDRLNLLKGFDACAFRDLCAHYAGK